MNLNYTLPVNTMDPRILNLGKFMEILIPACLEMNRIDDRAKEDYEKSQRTGQCNLTSGLITGERFSMHFTPEEETEHKVRYAVVANNKFNWLLENDGMKTPLLPGQRIFPGGVKRFEKITTMSGFYPGIDEAGSAICMSYIYDFRISDFGEVLENDFIKKIYMLSPMIEKMLPWS